MLFWIIAIAVTAIACAALYFAGRSRGVNASSATEALDPSGAIETHYRVQLADIEAALADGRLGASEANAAKAELARELLRRRERGEGAVPDAGRAGGLLPVSLLAIAVLAFGVYATIGNPQLPNAPLAGRVAEGAGLDMDAAVAAVEAQLARTPDDIRGWVAIAPVYMRMGRYTDAVAAYRRINELAPPTPDSRTNLAEALILANGDASGAEAMALLEQAAAEDPAHQRSRFYLASELTRREDFPAAIAAWEGLLAMGQGNEDWYATAQSGLEFSRQRQAGIPAEQLRNDPAQEEMIRGMVAGLAERLDTSGGSIEEWTQLVRSYLVLGDAAAAQAAYDKAKLAYPGLTDRADLDTLALQSGLK